MDVKYSLSGNFAHYPSDAEIERLGEDVINST
jgi:hypothetical protein